MRYHKAGDRYVVRLETGEDVVQAVTAFASDRRIDAASVSGIGSITDATLGYFDRAAREYKKHGVPGDSEIVSLLGNLSLKEGQPFAHIHVTLAGPDFRAVAGHLFDGKVAATCELVVEPLPGLLQRKKDARLGLFLLDV